MTLRFQVGNFPCIAIMDNAVRYPLAMFLTNLAKEQYEPLLRQRGQDPEQVELPYICLFIDTGRQRVLVDTGIGMRMARESCWSILAPKGSNVKKLILSFFPMPIRITLAEA